MLSTGDIGDWDHAVVDQVPRCFVLKAKVGLNRHCQPVCTALAQEHRTSAVRHAEEERLWSNMRVPETR